MSDPTEMNREDAIASIEKSVEALVEIQWKLHSYQTLTTEVRAVLFEVAMFYMEILMKADPVRALSLLSRMNNARVEKDAENIVTGLEEMLSKPQDQ